MLTILLFSAKIPTRKGKFFIMLKQVQIFLVLIAFFALVFSSRSVASPANIPACPCPTFDLVGLYVDAPFAHGDQYIFSITQDKDGNPLAMEHRQIALENHPTGIKFATIAYERIRRGYTLFQVDPIQFPLFFPGALTPIWIDSNVAYDLIRLRTKKISPQEQELMIDYRANFITRSWKTSVFRMIRANGKWALHDDQGVLRAIKLNADKWGIDGIGRLR